MAKFQASTLSQEPNGLREMFLRYSATGDQHLREGLVARHMNLVHFLAGKFAHRGEPPEDLVQVGSLGLLKAIDRYDPERGVEFSSFATPTILGEIKRYFRDRGWALKVPRRLQELNRSVQEATDKLSHANGRPPTPDELSRQLGIPREEVLEAMELESSNRLLSLESEVNGDEESRYSPLLNYLGRPDLDLEHLEDRIVIRRALHHLSERERRLIYLRFFEGLPQAEIGQRLGISQMHVSRLLARSLARLRSDLRIV